ncbi:MAG: hypothetical protein HY340_03240 [Candidatus Kerfeldbacteria bacterium]|nr:hypothetical protein [Candidatus Kerfeldbacteria bacterium]
MEAHETVRVLTSGQMKELAAALVEAIPADLQSEVAQYWISHKKQIGEDLRHILGCSTGEGMKPVRCRLLGFNHKPDAQTVLVRLEAEYCRLPRYAEAWLGLHRFTAEQLREHPVIALIDPVEGRRGLYLIASVLASTGEIGIEQGEDWSWIDDTWFCEARFFVVEA